MKIAAVSEKYHPYVSGGAERSLKILVDGFSAYDIEPVVITLWPESGHKLDYVDGVKVHYVELDNFYWPFDGRSRPLLNQYMFHLRDSFTRSMAYKLGKLLDVERPDLVHSNNLAGFGVGAWGAIKDRGIPIVHTIRDYYLMCPFSSRFRNGKNCETTCLRCRPFEVLSRRLSGNVDGVVGVSQSILQKHLNAGFFPNAKDARVIRNAAGMDISVNTGRAMDEAVRFAFMGRIVPEKGLELFLESLLGLGLDSWRVTIAGSGDRRYHSRLKARFDDHRIEWLSWGAPEEVYQAADFVVVPSLWHEPLSRVVLEAFSCGVPVIASRRGGITELVREGANGFLFAPGYPGDIRKVLQRVLQGGACLSREMRSACLEDAQNFTENKVVGEYQSMYSRFTAVS